MWGTRSFLDSRYASGVEARSCCISKTDMAQRNYPHVDLHLCRSTDMFIKFMCSPCRNILQMLYILSRSSLEPSRLCIP